MSSINSLGSMKTRGVYSFFGDFRPPDESCLEILLMWLGNHCQAVNNWNCPNGHRTRLVSFDSLELVAYNSNFSRCPPESRPIQTRLKALASFESFQWERFLLVLLWPRERTVMLISRLLPEKGRETKKGQDRSERENYVRSFYFSLRQRVVKH